MIRQPPSLVERTVHRIAVDSQANSWINRQGKRQIRARRWNGRVGYWQEAGQRPGAVTLCRWGSESGGAASQKGRPAGREAKEEEGVEDRKEGDDGGD
jgi:hypothetical protein